MLRSRKEEKKHSFSFSFAFEILLSPFALHSVNCRERDALIRETLYRGSRGGSRGGFPLFLVLSTSYVFSFSETRSSFDCRLPLQLVFSNFSSLAAEKRGAF